MELSAEDIREFVEIWREEFGEEIPAGDARHRASRLIELFAVLAESSAPRADDTLPHHEPK